MPPRITRGEGTRVRKYTWAPLASGKSNSTISPYIWASGNYAYHTVARIDKRYAVDTELQIAPQVSIINHHTLGKTHRA